MVALGLESQVLADEGGLAVGWVWISTYRYLDSDTCLYVDILDATDVSSIV